MQEDQLWNAALRRDAAYDGRFVFAVRSTGIYCVPSCPARRPKREHVLFFDQPGGAEAAGFRACRRCTPGRDTRPDLVTRACEWIDGNLFERMTRASLGRALHANPRALERSFKQAMGISYLQYAAGKRLETLRDALRGGSNVTGAQNEAGFGSSSRLYEKAGARLGMTPGTYGKRGRGVEIRFVTLACPLGRLLVAATERGICAVRLGDRDRELEAGLRSEFAAADIRRDRVNLRERASAVVDLIEQGAGGWRLPLDLQATGFQMRVWSELCRIPRGETRTYSQVARQIGLPKSARAVGSACASNPVAPIVPCHRVVREDGGLGGYRWDVKRKRELLEREAK